MKPPPSILIVDDDPVDVRATTRMVRKLGLSAPVVRAADGVEALEMLRNRGSEEIDPQKVLVVLDLNMPRMGGIEFLEVLRDDPELKNVPVIVQTASESPEDHAAADRLAVAAYVCKGALDESSQAIGLVRRYLTTFSNTSER